MAERVDQVNTWRKLVKDDTTSVRQRDLQMTEAGKVGFVIMVGKTWPMERVWQDWLQGVDRSRYKIVIHTSSTEYTPSAAFRNDVMDVVVPTRWCGMVPAVLAATRVALEDPAVRKLVYFCGSTVPLKPFEAVFSALLPPSSGRGMMPLSEMCTDEDWRRGMPWSYVLTRRDAQLFTRAEATMTAMFEGVHTCDIEDWFVTALNLAQRPYSTSCVTWNGWSPSKGFSTVTNGQHYEKIVGSDPTPSWWRVKEDSLTDADMVHNGSSGSSYHPSSCRLRAPHADRKAPSSDYGRDDPGSELSVCTKVQHLLHDWPDASPRLPCREVRTTTCIGSTNQQAGHPP